MNTVSELEQKMAKRFQQKRLKLSNGDLMVPLGEGVWNLFTGMGFNSPAQIRITRSGVVTSLRGPALTPEFKRMILAEMGHGATRH